MFWGSLAAWMMGAAAVEPASAVTGSELDSMVAELVPAVELITGRKFAEVPEVVAAEPEAFEAVLFREQVHLLTRLTGATQHEAESAARQTASATMNAFAGKYGFLDEKLYISVGGLEMAAADNGLHPRWVRPMLQLVLAHELTHALQDQQTDLDAMVSSLPDEDAVMAVNCMIEGHAMWVQGQIAEVLDLGEAHTLLGLFIGSTGPDAKVDPSRFQANYIYGKGHDFIEHHAHGGSDELWEILSHPPMSTSMIAHPATYTAERIAVDKRAVAGLRKARRMLGERSWEGDEEVFGDYDFRDQLLRSVGELDLAEGVGVAWHSRASGDDQSGVGVQWIRFSRPGQAQEYLLGMTAAAVSKARMSRHDPFVDAEVGERADIGDLAAQETVVLTLPGAPPQRLSTLWVVEGADVLQVVLVNRELPASLERKAVLGVFRKLP